MLSLFFVARSSEYAFISFDYTMIFYYWLYLITAETAVKQTLHSFRLTIWQV